jgi:hypothetical protein
MQLLSLGVLLAAFLATAGASGYAVQRLFSSR